VALVELELWPNFVHECRRRQIPLAVINGRLSPRSFRRYRLIRSLVRPMFASLSFAAVQDEAYADRFIALGAPADRVHVTGTMKWDTASIADHVPGSAELAAAMGVDRDRPLIVCGSTGPGEEALMIEALGSLTDSSGRRVQLMIVPRKPERFEDVAEVLDQPTRRSACPDGTTRQPDDRGLFLLDTMGELRKAYALADVVVVGRSFSPQYGSDMMEPIALGKPTVIGPNTSDFADQMQRLLAGDGIIQVPDASALRQAAEQLLGTERGVELAANGRNVILACQGATRRHAELLHAMLRDSGSSAVSAGHVAAVQGE
jgi:3-deoxy-D-manno-octulosonic-acid transferase